MRPLALFAALLVLPLGGCTLTIPLATVAAPRSYAGPSQLPGLFRDGESIVLVTYNGRSHRGYWRGVEAGPADTTYVVLGTDNVERRFPARSVRATHRPTRQVRASDVAVAFVAGLAVDALLVGFALHQLDQSCLYGCSDDY